jgi:hypothetical protein
LILTVDANFRLKCKDRGNKTDISLGDGWAYWVPQPEYKEYLRKHSHQIEVSVPDNAITIPNAIFSSRTSVALNYELSITQISNFLAGMWPLASVALFVLAIVW